MPPAQYRAKRVRLVNAMIIKRTPGYTAGLRQINHRGRFVAKIEECLAQTMQQMVARRPLGGNSHVAQNGQLCKKYNQPMLRLILL
jgi:hypothetical protein